MAYLVSKLDDDVMEVTVLINNAVSYDQGDVDIVCINLKSIPGGLSCNVMAVTIRKVLLISTGTSVVG